MSRIFIEFSYDGSKFHGFQRQNNLRSVQKEIEEALEKMHNWLLSIVPRNITVIADDEDKCCTSYHWGDYSVVLGKKFYENTFNDHDDVDEVNKVEKYKLIGNLLIAAFYHEAAHIEFTPFKHHYWLLSRCNDSFASFGAQVINILEDVHIESRSANKYVFTKKYFDALSSVFSQPQMVEATRKAISEYPDDPGTMLAHLLFYCRGVNEELPPHELWDKYSSFILKSITTCTHEFKRIPRVNKALAFALQLWKILNH